MLKLMIKYDLWLFTVQKWACPHPKAHSALNRPMVSEPLLIKPGKHTVFGMKTELIATVRAIPLTYT